MESQTGLSGQLVPGIAPDEMGQQLKDDKVQLAVFHGFEYAWVRQKHPELKPLMIAVNQNRHLRANLVVRDDCPATTFADLKGKTLAVPRRAREHCHLFLDRHCQAAGSTAKDYFGRLYNPNSAEDALDGVVSGQICAALVDSVALNWYRERKPKGSARLKTLEQSVPFPAAVVVYRAKAIDEATLKRFREGMISAKDNPRGQQLMTLVQITSFEPIPDDYDQLLTEIAKTYPPPADK
jgi:ABC-type phosphate/phosphonate transport system substrate-binding protein